MELKTFEFDDTLTQTFFVKLSFKQSQDQDNRLREDWPRDIQLLFCDEMSGKQLSENEKLITKLAKEL